MIRTIIIEDELNVRSGLKKMFSILEPTIEIIGETGFVKEGISLIETMKPDLVFMDVELEDGTCFDLLNQLEQLDFQIIFTTAYNQYAITAFKYSAVDYILKPVDPSELKGAIARALDNIKHKTEHQELLNVIKNNLEEDDKKIILKTTEQHYVISTKDIIHLQAGGAYTIFITTDKKIIVSKNIKHYQEILGEDFIRCHQSHLVQKRHIVGFDKNGFLQMNNDDLVAVSTRKKSEIVKMIKEL